jgi:hypothetical protein
MFANPEQTKVTVTAIGRRDAETIWKTGADLLSEESLEGTRILPRTPIKDLLCT